MALSQPRANTQSRPPGAVTAAGAELVPPPSVVHSDHVPLKYALCQTALSAPRAKKATSSVYEAATAALATPVVARVSSPDAAQALKPMAIAKAPIRLEVTRQVVVDEVAPRWTMD